MHRIPVRRPSPALIVALIALFVALGGGAYAATSLPSNSVGAAQLKTSAVVKAKIAANAVTSAKVKNGTLVSADFKSGQLPRGPKGATGARGPAGIQGPAGVAGAPGSPGISGLVVVSATSGNATGSHDITATCPTGKKAIGGGWNDSGVLQASNESITLAHVVTDGTGFQVQGKLSDGTDSWTLTAQAICATVSA